MIIAFIFTFIFIVMAIIGFIHNEILSAKRERELEKFWNRAKKEHPNLQIVEMP